MVARTRMNEQNGGAEKGTVRFRVRLNGTKENRYEKLYGLKQNPFPQIAKYEYRELCWLLNNLEAVPIRDPDHLRQRMTGANSEFVELCCRMFKPGEVSEFFIEFDE